MAAATIHNYFGARENKICDCFNFFFPIYFQITDPKLYTYGVEYPMSAIENLTATTLRNIIGDMELQTGSKSGKEHVKAVYCHPAYLTYMQSTS